MARNLNVQTLATFSADALSLTQGEQTVSVPLAPQRITGTYFRHSPPTPVEFEYAIQDVEDSLQPAYHRIGGGSLRVMASELHGLLEFVPPTGATATLDRVQLEAGFSRLAALSEGRPSSQDPLPSDAHFAATLLILRELMHHLDFSDLYIDRH